MTRTAAAARPVRASPGAERSGEAHGSASASDPLFHSPRMAAQRRQLRRAFGPHAVAQLGKEGKGADDGSEGGGALVSYENIGRNLQLLQQAFPMLPENARQFLLWLRAQLAAEEDSDSDIGSGAHALVASGRQPPLLQQVLGMDPSIFATVLIGLRVMPEREVLPRTLTGVRQLFLSLATARYSLAESVPLLEDGTLGPVAVDYDEGRGVEHVQMSCYAASLLNLIAAVPAYRRLFDSARNPTHPDSDARLLQDTIAPMLRTLGGNGTVRADDVMALIQLLDQLGLLQGGEAAIGAQQDASHVLMGILQQLQPWQDQLLTSEAVEYDQPGGANQDTRRLDRQSILPLTAVGHRTLEDALIAYFTVDVRRGQGIANPHKLTTRAVSFPPVLSIGVMRAGPLDHIDMPEVFRVPAQVTASRQPGPRYRLQAFIVRNTISHASGGHYVAVMRDGMGGWAESDDMGEAKEGEPGVMTPRTRGIDIGTHTVGDHLAPAYAMATLYTYVLDEDQDDDAPDRVSFPGSLRLGEDAIARSVFEDVKPEDVEERERLTREFLKKGGTVWDAVDLMRRFGANDKLATAYELNLWDDGAPKEKFKAKGPAKDLSGNKYYAGFRSMATANLLAAARELPAQVEKFPAAGLQLEAVTALLRERQAAQRGEDYIRLFSATNDSGTSLEIFGTENVIRHRDRLGGWIDGVKDALLGSAFIASRRPALVIRIRLRPTVTDDIASTYSVGNRININLDDYQVSDFSVGQTIGLLAHEIGVHSLDSTTLSDEELAAEEKDKDSKQTGRHQGTKFSIFADKTLKKQQADHLTIGRGILGQLSALPRLNMYESTLISLLEALPEGKDRWEAAAAYCIDIARILVNNDDPTAMLADGWSTFTGGNAIAWTAANEWDRMRTKYAKNKAVTSIRINYFEMLNALRKLAKLLEKVRKEAKKK